jgi:hypothetical protein
MHEHTFILIKEVPLPMLTTHNYYECECGEKKEDYTNPAGNFSQDEGR